MRHYIKCSLPLPSVVITIMFHCCLSDLEDIQRKRMKQIPNLTSNDGFRNNIGVMTFVDLFYHPCNN